MTPINFKKGERKIWTKKTETINVGGHNSSCDYLTIILKSGVP